MPSKDKEIVKKNSTKWYRKNKSKQVARQRYKRRQRLDWLLSYKKTLSCVVCDMDFSEKPECCDFHHINPATKRGQVLRMAYFSMRALLDELIKCVPVCANCHRTLHR